MKQLTKDNPGCYHDMIDYLCELTGASEYKDIVVKNESSLYHPNKSALNKNKRKLKYKAYDIYAIDSSGNKYIYHDGKHKYSEQGVIADHFIVRVKKTAKEFNIRIDNAGSYKESFTGGWYTKIGLEKIGDKYFATGIECSC